MKTKNSSQILWTRMNEDDEVAFEPQLKAALTGLLEILDKVEAAPLNRNIFEQPILEHRMRRAS